MKKIYIVPTTKNIVLGSEANMLVTVSGGSTGDETPEGFTDKMGGENGVYAGDLSNRRGFIWGED